MKCHLLMLRWHHALAHAPTCFLQHAPPSCPQFKSWPIILAIAISWGIAFFEYCLQVPANR